MTWMTLLAKLAVVTFVISSMLAMGASLTVAQIVEPLRNGWLVLGALIANFVLMPLAAILVAKALRLEDALAVGLLLTACTAGAPFLPKLAQLARGGVAFAIGLMTLLMVATVAYLPIVLPRLIPNATVDPWKIARSLLVLMLLPLVLGLVLRARYAQLATRVKSALDKISNISLILVVVLITALNIDKVVALFGTYGILAALLFIAIGLGVGWLFGGRTAGLRRVLALGTAQRNIGAALIVGGTLGDPKVVVMVLVIAILGLIVLLPLSRVLGRR